jgi:V/A-type H+-transporting ATPase subunit C
LRRELGNVFALLRGLSPAPEVVELLTLKYDYHNLKTALKTHHGGGEAPFFRLTPTPPEAAARAAGGDPRGLPGPLAAALAEAEAEYAAAQAPGAIDWALDRAMYRHALRLANGLGCGLITEYVSLSLDFYNLKTLLRVRALGLDLGFLNRALAEGGGLTVQFFAELFLKDLAGIEAALFYKPIGAVAKEGLGLAALEKRADQFLLRHLRQARYCAFGPEVLFAYGCAKEHEARQIRVVLTGKLNRIPRDVLRERLRDVDV